MLHHSGESNFDNMMITKAERAPRFLSQNGSSIKNSTTVLNQTFSNGKTNGFKEFRISNDIKEI